MEFDLHYSICIHHAVEQFYVQFRRGFRRKISEVSVGCTRKLFHTVWYASVTQAVSQPDAGKEDRTQIGMRTGERGIPCHQQGTIHHCCHLSELLITPRHVNHRLFSDGVSTAEKLAVNLRTVLSVRNFCGLFVNSTARLRHLKSGANCVCRLL